MFVGCKGGLPSEKLEQFYRQSWGRRRGCPAWVRPATEVMRANSGKSNAHEEEKQLEVKPWSRQRRVRDQSSRRVEKGLEGI